MIPAQAVQQSPSLATRVRDVIVPVLQKIAQAVYSVYLRILQTLHLSEADEFSKIFSYESIFSTNMMTLDNGKKIDLTLRRFRTDGEPDDCSKFVKMARAMGNEVRKTGIVPRLDIIVSEGSEEILSRKVQTLKIVLCELVRAGHIPAKTLTGFRFFKEASEKIDDDKRDGFNQITHAAVNLLQENLNANTKLMSDYFSNEAQPVDSLYQEFEQMSGQKKTVSFQVYELSFAPVDRLVSHYEKHPEQAKNVTYIGYGSYNLTKAIKRIGNSQAAEQVAKVLNSFERVFSFEAFLGTRFAFTDEKGVQQKGDFNKVGASTDPEIFAPLLAPDCSPLQRFFMKAFKGWNAPALNERVEYFKREFGDKGNEFVEALRQKCAEEGSGFTIQKAFDLYPKYFTPVAESAEQGDRKTKKKIEDKLKVLHNILINQEMQGTLSDYTVGELLDQGQNLLSPACVASGRKIVFTKEDGRMNTTFAPAGQGERGSVYSVESIFDPWKGNHVGVDIAKLKERAREFFSSLKSPSPAPLNSRSVSLVSAQI